MPERRLEVLLHADGGPSIGAGHVVRCLALAEELHARGHGATLVGHVEGALLREGLRATGTQHVPLSRDEPPGPALARLAEERGADVVHVDRYDVGELVEALEGGPLLTTTYDGPHGVRAAHLSFDPTLGAEHDPPPHKGPALRGVRFAPLRRGVTARRGEPRDATGDRLRVLVVMGGTDARGLLPRVLELLGASGHPLDVVAVDPTATGPVVTDHGSARVTRVPPDPDIAALLAGRDLVVSAAGTSVLELLCLGVPAALVQVVENQRTGYDRVLSAGAAFGLGDLGDTGDLAAARAVLAEALTDEGLRDAVAARGRRLVDGLGAWRVVGAWEHLAGRAQRPATEDGLEARDATLDDAATLLGWRNDPSTRSASRSTAEVGAEEHRRWLEASLGRDDRHLLVVRDGAAELGTVRWDRDEAGEWEVSITVAPEHRGRGLAAGVLAAGERALLEREPGAVTLLAAVHVDNAASRRLFAATGWTPDLPADDDGFVRLLKQPRTA
ncbi:bifunctional UDP-2,4-diacetamido-2,4,6-trideoxy-beta-L-altropyranose hydrolase/GNAT family N-acetyltransferase [Nocardioides caldifontis]|uniref:bifunctional UDP-2,4-diacetamido-2,4,6-trideoxy-beta-L-altropyranose hydrolase/GNAT family N-acetyltransferase n=1 Tax=Nocardioides caldifontis TaxID=2588938 RepID=UPI0019395E81|nr:bifunctional UDP-2,4-diacetamido-2,4,6-trideoxy-beta-L-altropyranose hydrolase/GNAT family N-acetyltransferase [Nocardioides caldifontis]